MHMDGLYAGEIFYNLQIYMVLEKYCGVDLVYYLGNKKDHQGKPLWMRWIRPMTCLVFSPYTANQGLLWAIDVVRGDRSEPDNLFRWDKVRLNLPGVTNNPPMIH